MVKNAFAALAEVHEAGVIHRSLTPDRVHLQGQSVTFSDFVIARIEGENTIAAERHATRSRKRVSGPECRVGLEYAVSSSDVFSLAASLLYWITGYEPKDPDSAFPKLLKLRSELQPSSAAFFEDIIAACLVQDDRKRPSAKEIAEQITAEEKRRADDASRQMRSEVFQDRESRGGPLRDSSRTRPRRRRSRTWLTTRLPRTCLFSRRSSTPSCTASCLVESSRCCRHFTTRISHVCMTFIL